MTLTIKTYMVDLRNDLYNQIASQSRIETNALTNFGDSVDEFRSTG